ncbi:hypothetical protein AH2_00011 [Burkholderia phage vB_BceS_AH2]|uniref:Uncharacterized protein n=1 Tax=Burkholderia phage vB_BceS_AH2 TaxID=1133022 RepID=I6NSF3_9CAUD|nr:hypothetical protein B613_gp11 [Burkholderia phage vB_BceS_AH2]AEY69522.1 hypothetical protein AH2_00011 [Burkholderia phage vB_BceS_AH2]
MLTPDQIDTAARHFIIAAIWADCPEGTHPRATSQARNAAWVFVERFSAAHPDMCAAAMECDGYGSHPDAGSPAAAFGHDLFLTCAGHGAGFSDRRELGELGDRISDAIRAEWRRWHLETEFYRGWLYLHAAGV